MKKLLNSALELAGLLAAVLCLIDCIVLPVLLAFSPFLGRQLVHGLNDQMATLIVVVLCLTVFVPGYFKHRSLKVVALASTGIFLVFFANLLEGADHLIHALVCVSGSAFIIKANLMSRKLAAKTCSCHHE